MELLDERRAVLVIRELVSGSERFNELRRGLPRLSPALLSKRLGQLARAGLVGRRVDAHEVHYHLTPAGREPQPIVEALGAWGVRWIGHLGAEDLDPHLLLWNMHRDVDRAALPGERTVVHFRFPDVAAASRHGWLVITADDVDVCDTDPGHAVSVTVTSKLACMTRASRGELSWSHALHSGDLTRTASPPSVAACRAGSRLRGSPPPSGQSPASRHQTARTPFLRSPSAAGAGRRRAAGQRCGDAGARAIAATDGARRPERHRRTSQPGGHPRTLVSPGISLSPSHRRIDPSGRRAARAPFVGDDKMQARTRDRAHRLPRLLPDAAGGRERPVPPGAQGAGATSKRVARRSQRGEVRAGATAAR